MFLYPAREGREDWVQSLLWKIKDNKPGRGV